MPVSKKRKFKKSKLLNKKQRKTSRITKRKYKGKGGAFFKGPKGSSLKTAIKKDTYKTHKLLFPTNLSIEDDITPAHFGSVPTHSNLHNNIYNKVWNNYTVNVDKSLNLLPCFLNRSNILHWVKDINNLQFYEKDNNINKINYGIFMNKEINNEIDFDSNDYYNFRCEPLRLFIKDPLLNTVYNSSTDFYKVEKIHVGFLRCEPCKSSDMKDEAKIEIFNSLNIYRDICLEEIYHLTRMEKGEKKEYIPYGRLCRLLASNPSTNTNTTYDKSYHFVNANTIDITKAKIPKEQKHLKALRITYMTYVEDQKFKDFFDKKNSKENTQEFLKIQKAFCDFKGRIWHKATFKYMKIMRPSLFPFSKPLYFDRNNGSDYIIKTKIDTTYIKYKNAPSDFSEILRKHLKHPIKKIDKLEGWEIQEQNQTLNGVGWMNEIVCKFTITESELNDYNATNRNSIGKFTQYSKEIYNGGIPSVSVSLGSNGFTKTENIYTFEYSLCAILNHIHSISSIFDENIYNENNSDWRLRNSNIICPVIRNFLNYKAGRSYIKSNEEVSTHFNTTNRILDTKSIIIKYPFPSLTHILEKPQMVKGCEANIVPTDTVRTQRCQSRSTIKLPYVPGIQDFGTDSFFYSKDVRTEYNIKTDDYIEDEIIKLNEKWYEKKTKLVDQISKQNLTYPEVHTSWITFLDDNSETQQKIQIMCDNNHLNPFGDPPVAAPSAASGYLDVGKREAPPHKKKEVNPQPTVAEAKAAAARAAAPAAADAKAAAAQLLQPAEAKAAEEAAAQAAGPPSPQERARTRAAAPPPPPQKKRNKKKKYKNIEALSPGLSSDSTAG